VYSVGTISINQVCPAANDVTEMQIQSGDTIKIKAMDWAGEITDLFHHRNKEAIHQAVEGLRTRYNGEFDVTILLDLLDQLCNPDPHWAFTSPAAMIGAAVYIFAVGLCLWKLCRQTREDPTPTSLHRPC